jgi:hypothetical protein
MREDERIWLVTDAISNYVKSPSSGWRLRVSSVVRSRERATPMLRVLCLGGRCPAFVATISDAGTRRIDGARICLFSASAVCVRNSHAPIPAVLRRLESPRRVFALRRPESAQEGSVACDHTCEVRAFASEYSFVSSSGSAGTVKLDVPRVSLAPSATRRRGSLAHSERRNGQSRTLSLSSDRRQ